MKIFSADQLKKADQITLEKQEISSNELMERAGNLVFKEIHSRLKGAKTHIKIFCGIGNNGGDGLVIGRLLIEHGYQVTVFVVNYSDKRSRGFLINYDQIKNVTKKWPVLLKSEKDFPEIKPTDFVVDAIFGIGLNRPLVMWVGKLIKQINESRAFILAVDIPSGMFADGPTKEKENIIRANFTLTFQAAKLVFFLPETGPYVGILEVLDIGLDKEFLAGISSGVNLVEKPEAAGLYRPREKFSHKGTFGHALLIGGSYGKMGSICLNTTAALRTGAGMATVFTPKCGYTILQTAIPEAMVVIDENEKYISNIDFEFEPSVICFGVGVGKEERTLRTFEKLLKEVENPMVIDADGLNLLSQNRRLLEEVPGNSVLTPHPKELERLIGGWENDFEKLEKTKDFSNKYQLVVVLKGANTMCINGDNIYINSTGNPGMATAGSGDVLAGVITGLMAQQYDSLSAAVLGVYLHGKAGDIAAGKMSFQGMIAGDIAREIGAAYLDLFSRNNGS